MKKEEVKCDKCNGTGALPADLERSIPSTTCPKCYGWGKLDWIENVVGKAQGLNGMDSTAYSTCIPVSRNAIPDNPITGALYCDADHNMVSIWDGEKWIKTVMNGL